MILNHVLFTLVRQLGSCFHDTHAIAVMSCARFPESPCSETGPEAEFTPKVRKLQLLSPRFFPKNGDSTKPVFGMFSFPFCMCTLFDRF